MFTRSHFHTTMFACAASFLLTHSSSATDLVWDADTATAGAQDGAGTWNTSNTNWLNGAVNQSFVAGDNVTIGAASGAAGTINVVSGGLTVGNLLFSAPGSSSYTITGGGITGGTFTKNGTSGLRLDNANSFTSIAINAGPNSASDGAVRLGNAGALGTSSITFGNTASMTGLYFLTGFGLNTTFTNDIAFSASTATTRLLTTANIGTADVGQTVTFSGILSGGSSTAIVNADNSVSAGVSRIKLTNAGNTVRLQHWNLNRGGLEFTSDAALGDVENDLRLDVTTEKAGTGLIFGAENIALSSTRTVTIQSATVIDTQAFTGSQINGAVTHTGLIYKKGPSTLILNGTGTGTGGVRIDAGAVQIGTGGTTGTMGTGPVTFNAAGTQLITNRSDALTLSGAITGLGSVIKRGGGQLTISGASNSYSGGTSVEAGGVTIGAAANIGTGNIQFTAVGTNLTITGTAVTLANNIILPSSGSGNITLSTPNTSSTVINGIVSGGGASTVWYFQGGASGQNTGALTLNGLNSLQGTINVQRGPLLLGNASAAGTAKIRLDSNSPAAGALQLGNFTINNLVELQGGASVGVATGNAAEINAVISSTSTTPFIKVGDGTLTITGTHTYTGPTTVSAGKLIVNGTLGSLVTTTVAATGTIGGNATFNGDLVVNGNLSPGNSPGQIDMNNHAVTMGSASTALFELGGSSVANYDNVIDISSLTLDGAWTVALVNGFNPAFNDTFDLFEAATVDASGFNVGTDLVLPGLSGDLSWDTSSFTSSGIITVIPEPSTALLGGIGLLAMLGRRRKIA